MIEPHFSGSEILGILKQSEQGIAIPLCCDIMEKGESCFSCAPNLATENTVGCCDWQWPRIHPANADRLGKPDTDNPNVYPTWKTNPECIHRNVIATALVV